jgi:hypothetical protein
VIVKIIRAYASITPLVMPCAFPGEIIGTIGIDDLHVSRRSNAFVCSFTISVYNFIFRMGAFAAGAIVGSIPDVLMSIIATAVYIRVEKNRIFFAIRKATFCIYKCPDGLYI